MINNITNKMISGLSKCIPGVALMITLLVLSASQSNAQQGIWKDINASSMSGTGKNYIQAEKFRAIFIDIPALRNYLANAPIEDPNGNNITNFYFNFPMPDGTNQKFYIVESSIMAPALAAQYPLIKTYAGQGIDDPTATVRFDCTQFGFHAQILSAHGSYYIDPYFFQETSYYISYDKKDFIPTHELPPCGVKEVSNIDNSLDQIQLEKNFEPNQNPVAQKSIGTQLRKYDLALAATGEYTAFHGGTTAGALAAMNTSVNRVDGIYEREVDIRMVLIANTNLLIYTNSALDPYTNNNGGTMLQQNQTTITTVIGNAGYDIGHVFSTGGGGIANLASVCSASNKAKGVTGSPAPVGDPFDVDYVAHEMGHQFGGNHTFNCTTFSCGGGNRSANSAYEPGSGSTIMAYAGICSPNDLQPHSDPIFHTKSFDEITIFSINGTGNSCATITATGNSAPVINPGANYIIPYLTPFKLTGSATDPDGDTLTYCWEEYDLGAAGNWNMTNNTNGPLFRSFNPTLSPTRLFPKLSNILSNTQTIGEYKPDVARIMKFKLTCRDNKFGGGGVTNNDTPVQLQVINTGTPFAITSPNNTGILYCTNTLQTVTWNVGGTDVSPINTPTVNIYLSVDGGQTFPIFLGYNVPNTGSYQWWTPSVNYPSCRIWVEGYGNVFFDINDKNFAIGCADINEKDLSSSINVYPNPGNGSFYFAMDNNLNGMVNIKVFDKLGRLVHSLNANKISNQLNLPLDLGNLENGMYSVEFIFNEGKSVKRIVKM